MRAFTRRVIFRESCTDVTFVVYYAISCRVRKYYAKLIASFWLSIITTYVTLGVRLRYRKESNVARANKLFQR